MSMSTPFALTAVLLSAAIAAKEGCAGPGCNTTFAAEYSSGLRGAGLLAAGAADYSTSSVALALVQREMEETGCCCHTNTEKHWWTGDITYGCCTCESCAAANPTCATYCGTNPSEDMRRSNNVLQLNRGGVCCPSSQYACHMEYDGGHYLKNFYCTSLGCNTSSSTEAYCKEVCIDHTNPDFHNVGSDFCWNSRCPH